MIKGFKTKIIVDNFLELVNPKWKYLSAKRVWGGLKNYYLWLKYNILKTRGHKLPSRDFD